MARSVHDAVIRITAQDNASRVINGISKAAVGMVAGFMSLQAVTGFLKDSIQAAAESERAWGDVAAALKRHGIEVESNIRHIKAFGTELRSSLGMSDELVGKLVQRFVDYGATVPQAMDRVRVAMDLAAGAGMDVQTATELLAKASVGATQMLGRYGIVIAEGVPKAEKFAAAVEQINQRFGGAAMARADDLSTKMNVLTESWAELEEAVGKFVTSGNVAATTLGNLASAIDGVTNAMESDISFWQKIKIGIIGAAGQYAWAAGLIVDAEAKIGNSTAQAQQDMSDAISNTAAALVNTRAALASAEERGSPVAVELRAHIETLTSRLANLMNTSKILAGVTAKSEGGGLVPPVPPVVIQSYETISQKVHKLYQMLIMFWAANPTPIPLRMPDLRQDVTTIIKPPEPPRETQSAWEGAKESLDDFAVAAEEATYLAESSFNSFTSGVLEAAFGMRNGLRDVFKGIAFDWMKYFIDAALGGLKVKFVAGILGILGGLFDNPVNDMMAAREGERFAMFFTRGAQNGFKKANLGASLPTNPLTGYAGTAIGMNARTPVTVVNQFNGVVSESFQRNTIELTGRASYQRRVQIQATNDRVFGSSLAFRSA